MPEGVLRCGCLAHFRRKFYDAIPSEDRKSGKSKSPAAKIVNLCSKLFEIERGFIDLSAEERKIKREASKEHEIWNQIWKSLDQISASKTSLLGKAVTYAQNQKPYMENYFLDGNIPISNNFTESCGAASLCTYGTKSVLSLGAQYHQTQQNSTVTHKFWISLSKETMPSDAPRARASMCTEII